MHASLKRNSKGKKIDTKILKVPIGTDQAGPIKTGNSSDNGFYVYVAQLLIW